MWMQQAGAPCIGHTFYNVHTIVVLFFQGCGEHNQGAGVQDFSERYSQGWQALMSILVI